ncbi:CYTH domain-containing protein [Erythrobacter sp.]|uniref:CYTH domain-containing protein n=1 Tax=Erythrobacter sp. TaxID=1042 RepID=UPI003C769DEE
MSDNLEIELKLEFAADDEAAAAKLTRGDKFPCLSSDILTTYFDTPDLMFRNAGFAVRIRSQDGQLVQTVKSPSASVGLFQRREWDTQLNEHSLDLGALKEVLGGLVNDAMIGRIVPVFETQFRRLKQEIETEQTRIERVIDFGEIRVAKTTLPVSEIELELLSGRKSGIFDLARSMNRVLPLRIGLHSKAARGYRLLQRHAPHQATRRPTEWSTDGSNEVDHRSRIASAIYQIRTLESESTGLGDHAAIIRVAELLRELSRHVEFWDVATNVKENAPSISRHAKDFANELQSDGSFCQIDTWQFRDLMLRVTEHLELEGD